MDHKAEVYLANDGRHWVTRCLDCFIVHGYLWTSNNDRASWERCVQVAVTHYRSENEAY